MISFVIDKFLDVVIWVGCIVLRIDKKDLEMEVSS